MLPRIPYAADFHSFSTEGRNLAQWHLNYENIEPYPLEAYEYIVNGKPALEWIMERYQLTRDKDSGITNNPNDWSDDPRYIIDLVKRIVRVSVESVKIVNSLPPLNER